MQTVCILFAAIIAAVDGPTTNPSGFPCSLFVLMLASMTSISNLYEIARLRRDLRVHLQHLQNLIDADLDCTIATRVVAHTQAQLRAQLAGRDADDLFSARAM